ncbi:MAG: transglutaminase domain-containing protein [Candidatus Levybacteria bacterium]|nr:transglutaminase domain-containing protein [Candidatus Levybacteria bacterium]
MKKNSGEARSRFARLFTLVFTIFILSLIFAKSALASNNFSTFYNITYQVSENGTTNVGIDVELKNKTSEFYANSYSIQTGFEEIKNIKGSDLIGELKPKLSKNNKGTLLSFSFNQKVVGINNSQKFKINFETSEIAKNFGDIWEINIPGISDQQDYETFSSTVAVPQTFGSPSIIKPLVKNVKTSANSLSFSKNDLGSGGISIAYGQTQNYSFELTYHLQNKNLYPIVTEIAIPSDNNYQTVFIDDINPRPIDVYVDGDGNWLAKYRLLPSKDLDVLVKGVARVSYKPRKEPLTQVQKQTFLKSQEYWNTNDAEIKKLASELKTPEKIYNWVVENLKYDEGRVKDVQVRAGAAGVLKNKNSAVCLEFTDLFIALVRAAGIPARSVEGYANTTNSAKRPLSLYKDVLHSWPQYYDFEKEAWIMVDPTWQNTTGGIDYFNVFDFDHFAFVVKGVDSQYPIPAGGYKIPGKKSAQDVKVSVSKVFVKKMPVLSASTNFSKTYFGGLSINGEIILTNNSGVLAPDQNVKVTSEKLNPFSQNLYFEKIPPYGRKVIPVKFNPRPFLTNETDTIRIAIGKDILEKGVVILPFYKHIYFIAALVGGLIIVTTTAAISIIVFKRRGLSIHR